MPENAIVRLSRAHGMKEKHSKNRDQWTVGKTGKLVKTGGSHVNNSRLSELANDSLTNIISLVFELVNYIA